MADGHLTMGELRDSEARMDAVEEEAAPSTLGDSMRLIEQEFPEVPSLIYDGPFSEHLTSVEPRMLGQTLKVDSERARKIAANFIGLPEARVSLTGKSEGGTMPCYYFSADADGGELMVEVSQQGGLVVNMLGTRRPESREIEAEEAVELAKGFLLRKGYENMAESYYMIQDNVLTANFAYMDGDVLCYSDLVKVSVALDNGAILGFEAKGYLTAHYDREIPEAAVSLEDARTLVSPELEILSEGLAIIPTAGQYESFCYEFKCAAEGDRHYIVYVNAVTGDQERILILLEDENGTLTL